MDRAVRVTCAFLVEENLARKGVNSAWDHGLVLISRVVICSSFSFTEREMSKYNSRSKA